MLILFGVPWQLSAVLGIHGPTAWRMPLLLFGFMRSAPTWLVPLYVLGMFSGVRRRFVRKPNFRTSDWMCGIECKAPACLWATPICREKEEAYLREEIHTKTTGHQHYEMVAAIATQLEVI